MKRKYTKPEIKKVTIDKEISLIMMSEGQPPEGPPDFGQNIKNNSKNEPFRA